ncbi:N-6 DNA methylase [Streptomyces sp. NBC_01433]|uniref:N-6 DNA methylase n=1 Tax=Streptomyces sp. NBC_01433 TaxID=2903864 RepID=UPI00225A156F|nr:N-6 DNA methylase [Streptomyces sp. NBC_01433]MCX4679072.1 N-6 DNA methylase [Streptomyces sp. NBC_01433]
MVTADGDSVHLSDSSGTTVTVETRPAADSYYTPRVVIETLIEMIDVCDPAMEITDPALGTGGILTAAHRELLAAKQSTLWPGAWNR